MQKNKKIMNRYVLTTLSPPNTVHNLQGRLDIDKLLIKSHDI